MLEICARELHDLDLVPLWMGRAKGHVIEDENNEYFKMVKVQWWVPMKKRSNLDERHLYEGCWNGKWKCNLANPKYQLDILAIFFSFLAQKNTINTNQITIFAIYVGRIKVNFDVVNASTNL